MKVKIILELQAAQKSEGVPDTEVQLVGIDRDPNKYVLKKKTKIPKRKFQKKRREKFFPSC